MINQTKMEQQQQKVVNINFDIKKRKKYKQHLKKMNSI
jgi:hypothetical protein